ncbi:hypothetical protein BKA83DRAFT_4481684 [Pisolithus microcarpus]|nr:hypothetical protein BKA83DRAFT_4481684 [Pisolithus microcarpus]
MNPPTSTPTSSSSDATRLAVPAWLVPILVISGFELPPRRELPSIEQLRDGVQSNRRAASGIRSFFATSIFQTKMITYDHMAPLSTEAGEVQTTTIIGIVLGLSHRPCVSSVSQSCPGIDFVVEAGGTSDVNAGAESESVAIHVDPSNAGGLAEAAPQNKFRGDRSRISPSDLIHAEAYGWRWTIEDFRGTFSSLEVHRSPVSESGDVAVYLSIILTYFGDLRYRRIAWRSTDGYGTSAEICGASEHVTDQVTPSTDRWYHMYYPLDAR